jgi:hypothetical protein
MTFIQNAVPLILGLFISTQTLASEEIRYHLGDKALGGTIVYINTHGTHGYVAANQDQGKGSRGYMADDRCKNPEFFDESGQQYMDWQLPPLFVLRSIYQQREVLGGFNSKKYYWSISPVTNDNVGRFEVSFADGEVIYNNLKNPGNVRCVRRF